MNNKELIDFANWLWDMDYLNINTQLPPFKNAETLANHYIKVKKLNEPAVSNSLDLRELERKLDEALGKETRETLTEWIKQQRQ